VIFHYPTDNQSTVLNDKLNTETVNTKLPSNPFTLRLRSNIAGEKYWRPVNTKNFIWGGYLYSIESITLTNQITSAFNRNDDLPADISPSKKHPNDTIEPLIPQASLIIQSRRQRLLEKKESINSKVSSTFLKIHIPIVSSTDSQSNLRDSSLNTISYPNNTNLFLQMNTTDKIAGMSQYDFDLNLRFLGRDTNGNYPYFFIYKSSDTEINIYMTEILIIQGSGSTSYPLINTQTLTSDPIKNRIRKRNNEGKLLKSNNQGETTTEPIFFASLTDLGTTINLQNKLPAGIVNKDGKPLSNTVLKSVNRAIADEQNGNTSQTSNTGKNILIIFSLLVLIIGGFFIGYLILPFLWKKKNSSPIIFYTLSVIVILGMYTGLVFGYRVFKQFTLFGNDNFVHQNITMFLYIIFILFYRHQLLSNIIPPYQFQSKKLDEFKDSIVDLYNSTKTQAPGVFPLLTKTQFQQTIIDRYFGGIPYNLTLFKSLPKDVSQTLKKHLVYQPDNNDNTGFFSNLVKDLHVYLLKDEVLEKRNTNDFDIKNQIESLKIENENNDISVETNIGIWGLNIALILAELYLLFEIVIQIWGSFNQLNLNISDEVKNSNTANIIWNLIFGSILLIIMIFHWDYSS
jgi:F0F1-type ATP synthase assembly protein I